jgi:hypothetical protein
MMDDNPKPFVFVLMPFSEEFKDIYEVGIKPACQAAGAYCERVDEQIFLENILERIYSQIIKADIIVAEMTGRNPNVFYETGYAHCLGKRVVLLTQNAEDIPFDLKQYPHVVYGGSIIKLKEQLKRIVRWCVKNPLDSAEAQYTKLINGELARTDSIYRIRITSPKQNEKHTGEIPVTGTFRMMPPDKSVRIFVASVDEEQYWPQGYVDYDSMTKTWKGTAALYDKPPREAYVIVAKVGELGRILCDYFTRVGFETGAWLPLRKLNKDILVYDRVRVFK